MSASCFYCFCDLCTAIICGKPLCFAECGCGDVSKDERSFRLGSGVLVVNTPSSIIFFNFFFFFPSFLFCAFRRHRFQTTLLFELPRALPPGGGGGSASTWNVDSVVLVGSGATRPRPGRRWPSRCPGSLVAHGRATPQPKQVLG